MVGFVDKYGNYCDNLKTVAIVQLSSPWLFWFNLVTSVPVAWIEWITIQVWFSPHFFLPIVDCLLSHLDSEYAQMILLHLHLL